MELITSDVSDADMHNDADNHTDVDSYEVPMVPLETVPFASPTTNTVAFASNRQLTMMETLAENHM